MVGERLHGTDGIRGEISEDVDGENPIEKFDPGFDVLLLIETGAGTPGIVLGFSRNGIPFRPFPEIDRQNVAH